VLGRFGLYDFFANIIPGIFFLWALGTVLEIAKLQQALPLTGGLAETSVLIVVGYLTGLLLQGVSQLVTERALKRHSVNSTSTSRSQEETRPSSFVTNSASLVSSGSGRRRSA